MVRGRGTKHLFFLLFKKDPAVRCLCFFFRLSLPFPFFSKNMFCSWFVKTSVSCSSLSYVASIYSLGCLMCHIFRIPKLVVFHVLFEEELESQMEEKGY